MLPLGALADGEVTVHELGEGDSILLLRRGTEVRAFRNLCPHEWLPLTYHSRRILSADGTRLRCSSHGVEFSAEDGRPLDGAAVLCGLEPIPVHVDTRDRVVLRPPI